MLLRTMITALENKENPFKEHRMDWTPQQWLLYYAAKEKYRQLKQANRQEVIRAPREEQFLGH